MAKKKTTSAEETVVNTNEVWVRCSPTSDNCTVIYVCKKKPNKDEGYFKSTVKPQTYEKLFGK